MKKYCETVDLDFKIPTGNLPPRGAIRRNISIISLLEFLGIAGEKLKIPKSQIGSGNASLKNPEKLLQPILSVWKKNFLES